MPGARRGCCPTVFPCCAPRVGERSSSCASPRTVSSIGASLPDRRLWPTTARSSWIVADEPPPTRRGGPLGLPQRGRPSRPSRWSRPGRMPATRVVLPAPAKAAYAPVEEAAGRRRRPAADPAVRRRCRLRHRQHSPIGPVSRMSRNPFPGATRHDSGRKNAAMRELDGVRIIVPGDGEMTTGQHSTLRELSHRVRPATGGPSAR